MNLRWRHYLSILPLFLLLAASSTGLSTWIDYRQVLDNLQEEEKVIQQFELLWPVSQSNIDDSLQSSLTDPQYRLAKLKADALRRAVIFFLISILAGLLACEILIQVNKRELYFIGELTSELNKGNPPKSGHATIIREYADLVSSLGTLSKIKEEKSMQTRSKLLSHE